MDMVESLEEALRAVPEKEPEKADAEPTVAATTAVENFMVDV